MTVNERVKVLRKTLVAKNLEPLSVLKKMPLVKLKME